MSERFNPRKLKRARAAQVARGETPLEICKPLEILRERVHAKLEGSRQIVHCRHNVPWLDCQTCSTPKRA